MPEVFDHDRPEFAWAREELSGLLSQDEMARPRAVHAERALHRRRPCPGDMDRRPDSSGSSGARFWSQAAAAATSSASRRPARVITGVELEPVTAAIAAALYPGARIVSGSFADGGRRGASFDLVIGNVPFGRFSCMTRGTTGPGTQVAQVSYLNAVNSRFKAILLLAAAAGSFARNPAASSRRPAHARVPRGVRTGMTGLTT